MEGDPTIDPTLPLAGYWSSLEEAGLGGRIAAAGVDLDVPIWRFMTDAPRSFRIVSQIKPLHEALEDTASHALAATVMQRDVQIERATALVAGRVVRAGRNLDGVESATIELPDGTRLHLRDGPGFRRPAGPGETATMQEGQHVVAAVVISHASPPQCTGMVLMWLPGVLPIALPDYGLSEGANFARSHLALLIGYNLRLDDVPSELRDQAYADIERIHRREPDEDLQPDSSAIGRLREVVERHYGAEMLTDRFASEDDTEKDFGVSLGDHLRDFFATRWPGSSWWYPLAQSVQTIGGMLKDMPTDYTPWVADRDLQTAKAAARWRYDEDLRRERLGLETDDLDVDNGWDRQVLLFGHYAESPYLDAVRRQLDQSTALLAQVFPLAAHMPCMMSGNTFVGELTTNLGVFTVHGIHTEDDGAEMSVAGSLAAVRDETGRWSYSLREALGFRILPAVLPRWRGMPPGSCAARMAATIQLLDELGPALQQMGASSGLAADLRAIHAPSTWSVVDGVSDQQARAAILSWLVDALGETSSGTGTRSPARRLPEPRMLKGHEAAEVYAAEVLSALGFTRVVRTPSGADGGVDVVGDDVVAQVKMEALPTGRDRLQAIFGIAALEGKRAVFFSLAGYTAQAVEWGERAGIALFEFAFDGSIRAVNEVASRIGADSMDARAPSGRRHPGR